MTSNPIQYTSRSFLTALNDINSDPLLSDKPDWFKRLIAGAVDVASVWENATANNLLLRTAFTRRAVIDLCALIDYNPAPQISASGTFMFDANPATGMPFTVAQASLAALGPSNGGSSALRYGARTSLTFNALTETHAPSDFNISTGIISNAGAAFVIGEKVRFTTTGTLPTGLSLNTDYFVSSFVSGSPNTISVAATRALAMTGAKIIPSAQGSGTHTLTRLSRSITLWQEVDVASGSIGASDGVTAFQEFTISQPGIQAATLAIVINGVTWNQVTTLALSAPTDQVYRVYYNTDGSCTIRFGNGVYGAIPPAFTVFASYSYGGGTRSNVSNLNQITTYAGSDTNANGVFNATAVTGGADPESLDSARKNGPMILKARSRFITVNDGIALAMAYGGFSQIQINPNVYGILSCQVVGVAVGGGAPSSGTRSAVATYLAALTPLNSILVQFDIGTFTTVTLNANIHVKPGYLSASVLAYADIAVRLYFGDVGAEILSSYQSNGIAAAIALINQYMSKSLTVNDYATIQTILTQLAVVGTRAFGDLIQASDLYAVLAVIPGLDYSLITSSVIGSGTLPYQCAASEITQLSGMTVNLTAV